MSPIVASTKYVTVDDGTEVFYREAGDKDAPVFLLLHGHPSSSHQFRNLIPILAEKYRVIAPDLPAHGFTKPPADYKYTFENISYTIESFIDKLGLKSFIVYIFDYGAPTGLRIGLRRPELIKAVISQNGNAYSVGLTPTWEQLGIVKLWNAKPEEKQEQKEKLKSLLTLDIIKYQYTEGSPAPEAVAPETYTLDNLIEKRFPDANVDLYDDYQTNVDIYPQFHEFLRKYQPPTLAIWGARDIFFGPDGARAFKNDLKPENLEVVILEDGNHFPLESHLTVISSKILEFLSARGL